MMLCSRCQKRPAVVFITRVEGDKNTNEGLCLSCAKELGIKPVDDMLQKMGIGEEELQQMDEQLSEMMSDENFDENDMLAGGAAAMPFLQNLFGQLNKDANEEKKPSEESPDKKPNKKKDKSKDSDRDKKTVLDVYATNLTAKARAGELDAIIGRDNEVYRTIQILCRRRKNNPCLIGEPGVGKTAIAEALALRIAAGKVPYKLQNKEVFLLDLTGMVSGTQYRGQFETRIRNMITDVKNRGNVLLFIDEIHTLIDAGACEGGLSAANVLKPALSRGEVQVIGATTFNEYRKHIEGDAALERRFQPIRVEEPSIDDTVTMLKGIKSYYENYHSVIVSDALLRTITTLSERYITDRYLPDKAIDLLDEACATAALQNTNADEYAKLLHEEQTLQQQEKDAVGEEEADFEKIANIRAELLKTQDAIAKLRDTVLNMPLTEEHIACVLELWTGIPASKIRENELSKLADLENELRRHVIGQDEAIALVAAAIRRGRVQISPRRRPASFIFVGPTGVGKTELVKVLAAQLFDTPDTLIRLDMSEFMEKHAVSRIIGSPPGYVGYDEAGQLTEKVRRKPYSVILLDEIEKAHPDVLNILLQILDEGRVTDAHGRIVNFENTVIVMTSNAGSQFRDNLMGFGKTDVEASKDKATKALSEFLRPEFISRVDEVVNFTPLSLENYAQIAQLMLSELVAPLAERNITLTWTPEIPALLAEKAHGGKRGARDLRNVIRREVEDPVTTLIVHAQGALLSAVHVSIENDTISVKSL